MLENEEWKFSGGLVVRTLHFTTMAWVQSLVRELRSPKSCGTAKKKNGVLSKQGVSKEADWPVEISVWRSERLPDYSKGSATCLSHLGCNMEVVPPLQPRWLIQALSTLSILVCQGYHHLLIMCLNYCSLFLAGLPDSRIYWIFRFVVHLVLAASQ